MVSLFPLFLFVCLNLLTKCNSFVQCNFSDITSLQKLSLYQERHFHKIKIQNEKVKVIFLMIVSFEAMPIFSSSPYCSAGCLCPLVNKMISTDYQKNRTQNPLATFASLGGSWEKEQKSRHQSLCAATSGKMIHCNCAILQLYNLCNCVHAARSGRTINCSDLSL